MQEAMPVGMVVNLEDLSLQWMVITDDGDFRGETLEVGSMSYVPSTTSDTTSCLRKWPEEWRMTQY